MKLTDSIRKLIEGGQAPEEKEVNPKAKQMIQRRTKIIINPPLKENSDASKASTDSYAVLADPDAEFSIKNLAYQIIKSRLDD